MMNTKLEALSIAAIESGDFDVAGFDHEAHIYAAWLFLGRFPLVEAIERFSAALQRVTVRLGVPDKYHDTVTWFFMLLISERRAPDDGWPAFRRANEDLFSRDDNILLRYYSKERLNSPQARRVFVLPDRIAA